MSKTTILILVAICAIILVVTILRFSTLEDTWICQNGTWIKHGNPSSPQPTTVCRPDSPSDQVPIACTMEAKICPDGSAVGRMPPTCEFAPCGEISNSLLTETQATKIAQKSCIKVGEIITSPGTYNQNTKTWWFDVQLKSTPEGCHPACVVKEDKSVEINWRCTGLNQ